MTETNPAGTVGGSVPAGLEGDEARLAAFARQGRFMFGVEMSVRGEDEREVPWDGASPGRLLVRGPCVVSGYFGADAPAGAGGGWFATCHIPGIGGAQGGESGWPDGSERVGGVRSKK